MKMINVVYQKTKDFISNDGTFKIINALKRTKTLTANIQVQTRPTFIFTLLGPKTRIRLFSLADVQTAFI